MNLYEMTVIVETRLQYLRQQHEQMQLIDMHSERTRKNIPLMPVLILVVFGVWLGLVGS